MINENRTIIIRDAELHWAKLVTPVDPFKTGEYVWELQLRTRDKDTAKSWKTDYYLTVKEEKDDDGEYWKANVKRKLLKKNGDENEAPAVLDGKKQAIDASSIGNGSIGNVMLFQYPYDVAGRKGVSSILSKVQVTDLKVYTQDTSTDFDVIESTTDTGEDKVDF